MRVEVDQSGKIGDTKIPTALAFSDGIAYSILIPATVKRACIQNLRGGKKLETRLYVQLFSVCLYLLIKRWIHRLDEIVIDQEYPGHEGKIKEHAINLLRRAGLIEHPPAIHFALIGKRSKAHQLAFSTFKSRTAADKIIRAEEILREFKK
jgi:hypothetical protein